MRGGRRALQSLSALPLQRQATRTPGLLKKDSAWAAGANIKMHAIEPDSAEMAWAKRSALLERMALVGRLDRSDRFSVLALVEWSHELTKTLGEDFGAQLLPLFGQLFAAKDLRAMYVERRHSLRMQGQAAEHAAHHLKDTIAALEAHLQMDALTGIDTTSTLPRRLCQGLGIDPAPHHSVPPHTIGGMNGAVQRLQLRFDAQITALREEAFRARILLKEIEGTDSSRIVEVAVAAKEAELHEEISRVLKQLADRSLEALVHEQDVAKEADSEEFCLH